MVKNGNPDPIYGKKRQRGNCLTPISGHGAIRYHSLPNTASNSQTTGVNIPSSPFFATRPLGNLTYFTKTRRKTTFLNNEVYYKQVTCNLYSIAIW